MSIEEMSVPAPGSVEAIALAELEKEGHVIGTEKPRVDDGDIKDIPAPPKDEPKAPETPKEEPPKVDPPKEDKKPERTPTMVEAWKLEVATKQNEKHQKEVAELSAKLEELSKQKAPVTETQKNDLADEIKAIAKDKDVDVDFLTDFANKILSKAESKYRPNMEVENTVKRLQEERELEKELNAYSNEFDKDVLPLIAEHQLSGEALSQIKSTLRDYAFSETYAKVPLKEIFALKQSEFNLSAPKKSSEGKGIKTRASDAVDIDNMSDEDFAKLPADKVEEFMQKKSSGSWQRK